MMGGTHRGYRNISIVGEVACLGGLPPKILICNVTATPSNLLAKLAIIIMFLNKTTEQDIGKSQLTWCGTIPSSLFLFLFESSFKRGRNCRTRGFCTAERRLLARCRFITV